MDELRDSIWDFLYKAGESRSIDEIAVFLGRDREIVGAAIDHEWFSANGGAIGIAYSISADRRSRS